jgi:predicted metal-binding membrane protein
MLTAWAILADGLIYASWLFLIAAGLFQWSGLKDACLTRCRSPLNFLLNEWREGGAGALVMGLHHGAFCVGCCWLLMLLMFAGGVMNLLWMAAVTLYVLAEKLLPRMQVLGRLTGVLLIGAGVGLLTL